MSDATRSHRLVPMRGRDPEEAHRAASPMELLFDLSFVIAFSTAASQLAHGFATGHGPGAFLAFCFATFAISWAWINFAWFASAYDTDDWLYRATTMVQMVGVLVLALGLPAVFASIENGSDFLENRVMVLGYVIMRVAMILQWLRATRHDPGRRAAHRAYIVTLIVAQVLWCILGVVDLSIPLTFTLMLVPLLIELSGPVISERLKGGTPWHAPHIAERYSLMVIITLGEGLIGTMATLSALAKSGLTTEIVLLTFAGISFTFGLWWSYYSCPHAEFLARWRQRSFGWGYGHIVLFGAIVAVGSGLQGAALYIDRDSVLSMRQTVATIAIPLAVFVVTLFVLVSALTRNVSRLHLGIVGASGLLIAISFGALALGADLHWTLALLALTPWISVVAYETVGHRHNAALVESLD